MKKTIKVAVSGAGGQIAYAFLFRLASGAVFGQQTHMDLQLLEIEPALPALQGVVMELEDCAFPLLNTINTTSDSNIAFKDANWVILIGSSPRKVGMERSDLLKINGNIFKMQGEALNKHAHSDVRTFVVGNPCNTNCYILNKHAPDIPNDRFYAMTRLDQNRAQYQLAHKAGVTLNAVKHMVIWGNHSSTQYPDFYHATINNKPVTDVINDQPWLENDFIPMIQQRGAAVIKTRGASSAASAANGVIDSLVSLIQPTPNDEIYSVALYANGKYYGVDEGLIFSFPCRTGADGTVHIIENMEHHAFGQAQFQKTLDELRNERDQVHKLGLVD